MKFFEYKRLPRKDKKRRFGKRGRRYHIALVLLEEKNHKTIKTICDYFSPKDKMFPLQYLTNNKNTNDKSRYNW